MDFATLFKMLHTCILFIARLLVSSFLHSWRKRGTRCDVSIFLRPFIERQKILPTKLHCVVRNNFVNNSECGNIFISVET